MKTNIKIRSSQWAITIESTRGVIIAYLGHNQNHVIGTNQSGQKVDNFREERLTKETDLKDRVMAALWILMCPTDQEASFIYFNVSQWIKTGNHDSFINRVVRGERTMEQLIAYSNASDKSYEDGIPVGTTDDEWESRSGPESSKQFFERIIANRLRNGFYTEYDDIVS